MSERARALANQLRQRAAEFVETVATIDDAHWDRVPEPGVWSAGKDAEHVTQGALYHQWLIRTSALGDTTPRAPAAAATEFGAMVAERSRQEVLGLLAERAESSARLVESLTDAQLDLPAPPYPDDGPLRTVADMIEGQMIAHYGEHRNNIASRLAELV